MDRKTSTRVDKKPQWFEQDTRLYRVAQIAHEWHMDPITFLRQPAQYRRFLEYFLVAKSMKQEAAAEQHKERHQPNKFEQQASSWEQQAKKYFKIDQTGSR